jgi:hypothetical protein
MNGTLADQLEIGQLLARYTHAADQKTPDVMRDIFAADGHFSIEMLGVDVSGVDEIVGYFEQRRAEGQNLRHIVSNLVVDVDGDTATAQSYLTLMVPGEKPGILALARYLDVLSRTSEGWRISERRLEP